MTERELFEEFNKEIYKTCYFMLHHAADAEDVCQEVFMTVFRHDWRQVEHLKTWLLRVTVNHCLNHLKKHQRLRIKEHRLKAQRHSLQERAAETVVMEREGVLECLHLLERLPGKVRAAVYLKYMNELSLAEIGEILGIPAGTVKSRLHAGMKRMRSILEQETNIGEKEGGAHGQDRADVYPVTRR